MTGKTTELPEKNNTRLHWVDVAKGILILLVVLAHFDVLSRTVGVDHVGTSDIRVLNFLFTSFYMAAFFVLTGYTTNFQKKFSTFFIGSFKSLIIPAFCFSILSLILLSILYKDWTYVKSFITTDFWYRGFEFYWFLIALFLARICYWFLYKYLLSDIAKGAFLFVMMLLGIYLSSKYRNTPDSPFTNNPFFYHHFLRMAFFLWIRQMYKQYESRIKLYYLMWAGMICVVISICFRVLSIPIPRANYDISFDFGAIEIIEYIFFTLTGSGLIIYVSRKIGNNNLLEFFGRNSLIVYVTHFCIIRYIYYFTKPILSISDSHIPGDAYSLLVAGLTYLTCFYTIKLFSERPFNYLLGKF